MVIQRQLMLLLILLVWSIAERAYAQASPDAVADTATLYRVQTLDGNKYIGNILQQNEEFVQLRTRAIGEITIARRDIKSIVAIGKDQLVQGQFWFPNPQATRYFWSPNGYGLNKGEGYYQNV